MGEGAKQAGLETLQQIRQELKLHAPGARSFYSPEEKTTKMIASELQTLVLASQTASANLTELSAALDPFSPAFDQADKAIARLSRALASASNVLDALPSKYKSSTHSEV